MPLSFFQGSLQEAEDSEPDSSLSQSPNVQDWLSQARSTRTQQQHDNLLRQKVTRRLIVMHHYAFHWLGSISLISHIQNKVILCIDKSCSCGSQELQKQVAEQRKLLQSVASVGEELLSQQTTPNGDR